MVHNCVDCLCKAHNVIHTFAKLLHSILESDIHMVGTLSCAAALLSSPLVVM